MDDDWSGLPKDHPVKLAFEAGEPTPLKGVIYTCVGLFSDIREKYKIEGYELLDFDFSKYTNKKVYFKKDRFINLGEKPETKESIYNFSLIMKYKSKIPRKIKKKKNLKTKQKYTTYTFTHEC